MIDNAFDERSGERNSGDVAHAVDVLNVEDVNAVFLVFEFESDNLHGGDLLVVVEWNIFIGEVVISQNNHSLQE